MASAGHDKPDYVATTYNKIIDTQIENKYMQHMEAHLITQINAYA